MADLIERQAAIDAAVEAADEWDGGYSRSREEIITLKLRMLPSAQPDITDVQAIEHLQATGWMQNHDHEMYMMGIRDGLADDSDSYDSLIQPEQKVGKWIIKDNPVTGWYRVTCSECGEDVTSEIRLIGFIPNCKALWDYCPYCGAKMEEQDDRQRKSHC